MTKEFEPATREKNIISKFEVGNRVFCLYCDKWWRGTVQEISPVIFKEKERHFKILYETIYRDDAEDELKIVKKENGNVYYFFKNPDLPYKLSIKIKTDERVGEENDLLNGYGLSCPCSEEDDYLIFENDAFPIKKDKIEWNENIRLEDLPF